MDGGSFFNSAISHGEQHAIKMTTFWLNKCLNPFKLKNPSAFSLRTQVLLRNAAFSSCAHRIYEQNLTKQMVHESKPRKIYGQYCNILQREKDLDLCTFGSVTRQFHGSSSSVRFQEEKKPESLQELVEATERPQTALTVSQKGTVSSYFIL